MIDKTFGKKFADEWVEAWNTHDLNAILSHYDDAFEMTSPFIPLVTGESSGTLIGKAAVGEYWSAALAKFTDLKFDVLDVLVSEDSVVIYYKSARSGGYRMVAEVFIFGERGKVVKSIAHYDEI